MVKAVERAHEIGAGALQIFSDNPTAWRRRAAPPAELPAFRERLARHDGISALRPPANVRDSLQYFVVRIDASRTGVTRDELHERLREFNIMTRKYFQPLCSQYSCYRHLPSAQPSQLPVATRIAGEVLCLPLYGALGDDEVHRICDAVDFGLSQARRVA